MRILHVAPFNTAGVPFTLVRAEKALGYDSRLITLAPHPYNYPEDICLNLPFITTPGLSAAKKIIRFRSSPKKEHRVTLPPFIVQGKAEKLLYDLRDRIWDMKIRAREDSLDMDSFDLYELDGGMGLLRNARYVKKWKQLGKSVIAVYLGSDLRTRGVFRDIHERSSCNFTVEYDHINLYPGIHHIPFPFDFTHFHYSADSARQPVVIGHAPSNRQQKGTEIILKTLCSLQKRFSFELLLIENVPYRRALELKSACGLFIDQLSGLGYGVNSVESLAMGIPTFSSLEPHFKEKYPDSPLIGVTPETLGSALIPYLKSPELRVKQGKLSREWVREVHDVRRVVMHIHKVVSETQPALSE